MRLVGSARHPTPLVSAGLARRTVDHASDNGRPVAVLRPVPDSDATVHDFVLEQFPPRARRLAQ